MDDDYKIHFTESLILFYLNHTKNIMQMEAERKIDNAVLFKNISTDLSALFTAYHAATFDKHTQRFLKFTSSEPRLIGIYKEIPCKPLS